jgi:RNA polymerase sigma-70 factor (ECF subfamily)
MDVRQDSSLTISEVVDIKRLRLVIGAALRRYANGDDSEYEDLVQSVLEGVFRATDTKEPWPSFPPQWVTAIARNIAIDRLRARARERRLFADASIETEECTACERTAEPEHVAHVRQELRRLQASLERIGPIGAQVIYLHDLLGYALAEVADAIGISRAAAQSRLVRGRHALVRSMPP